MVHDDGPVGLDGVRVAFDDERAVADAGIVLAGDARASGWGSRRWSMSACDLGERPGAANAGRKVMTLVSAMALGADCIDDCDVLRCGADRRRCSAIGSRRPRRWGRFCARSRSGTSASSTACSAETLTRAWAAGAGPGDGRLVVDVDSFVGEVYGRAKQGAAFGYTRVRGYHPILATRADTGEVLHIRLRKGSANTRAGMLRFCEELIARVDARRRDRPEAAARRLGVLEQRRSTRLERAGWQYSIGVRLQPARPRRRSTRSTRRLADAGDYPPTARRRSPRPRSAAGG